MILSPAIALVWGVALFLPYPALPVGGNTGLQPAHFLMLGLVPLAFLHRARIARAWWAYGALAAPQVLGLLITGLRPVDLNATASQLLAMLAIPVTALVFCTRPRDFLNGVGLVLSAHGLVGIYQFWAFGNGQFPLPWLYVNPSFAPFTDEYIEIYTLYIKRPFGMMPEASALLATVSPWLLLLVRSAMDAGAGRHQGGSDGRLDLFTPTPWRVLGLSALLVTLMMSASGGIVFLGFGLASLTMIHAMRNVRRSPLQSLMAVIGVFLTGAVALLVVSQRYESEANQLGSWDERAISIRIGFRLLQEADLLQMWFGYGGGQVTKLADQLQSTSAVHSWMLTQVISFGLLGAAGLIALAWLVVAGCRFSRDRLVWGVLLAVWMAGPTLMTGYYQLLGIWGFLALPLTLTHRYRTERTQPRVGAPEAGGDCGFQQRPLPPLAPALCTLR